MRFQLVRYFTLASLGAISLVAAALMFFERQQSEFFKEVQTKENAFFQATQDNFAKQQDEAARRDLLTIHEAGNVNLTRLFANALWERDFAPFVAKASLIPVDACRAIADVKDDKGKMVAPKEKKDCFSEVGKQIMAIPGFKELDAKVYDSMKKSTVFKVKVFDLRGITVYSSEHKQIGEDKAFNAGWKKALAGTPASELTHRDKFSAFEGVVENRDVISSYLPVLGPGTDKIVGVFEVYSDVTPFLAQIKKTSEQIKTFAAVNQKRVEESSAENEGKVEQSSNIMLGIVAGLLLALFALLYVIVRRAQGIIEQQEKEREHAQQQLAQSEKMASLGQMVAGVAHQLNTPLAFSHSNVSMAMEALKNFELPLRVANRFADIVKRAESDDKVIVLNVDRAKPAVSAIDPSGTDVEMLTQMLGDTLTGIDQMRELVENLRDFTRLDRAKVTEFDLNKGLHNVVYIAKSVIPTRVTVVEDYHDLPVMECNPSQLNQVFLNLINNAAQSIADEGSVTVRSSVEGGRIRVDVIDTGSGIPPDVLPHIFETYYTTKGKGEGTGLGLPIARTIVEEHGGEIKVATEVGKGSTFTVFLPAAAAMELKKAA